MNFGSDAHLGQGENGSKSAQFSERVGTEAQAANVPKRRNALQCPRCFSYRAILRSIHPPRARCADCDSFYQFKPVKRLPAEVEATQKEQSQQRPGGHKRKRDEPAATAGPSGMGAITKFIDDAIKGGPEGFRAAQREANRLTRKLGVTFNSEWFICTPWLKEWASGSLGTRANGLPSTNGAEQRGEKGSRVRVRVAISWRARWLRNYAMSGSKVMACRNARVGHSTVDYHLKNDPDFAEQAEAAKAHAIDLLFTRCMQRCLEGDVEPIYSQGILVDHVRKFDSRLQTEMLRALMPATFKTPGTAGVHVETGDKILAMDEATRAKLIEMRREHLLGMKAAREAKDRG